MNTRVRIQQFLVCDDNAHVRRLVMDVLNGAGFGLIQFANDGNELLQFSIDYRPRIVITSSRIPGLSGLEYCRLIRNGYHNVDRTTSIILMTNTPTEDFLDNAREAGVDEMLCRPFTGAALLARVEAVLIRPRRFVESIHYVGPCRRRRMLDEYGGPLRRFTDPLDSPETTLWEAATNRELVRACITKISELTAGLNPADRRKLREIFAAVKETEAFSDEVQDEAMGASARSLGRYISALGATGVIENDVLTTHISAMHQLSHLGAEHHAERDKLVTGLVAVVDKRLARAKASARATAEKPALPPPSRRPVSRRSV